MADEVKTEESKNETGDLFVAQSEKTNKLLEELVAQARQQREAPKAETPKEKPVRYTTAQLQAAVDSGKLSQADALEVIRLQERADIEAEVERKIAARLEASSAASGIQKKIDAFTARVPNVLVVGSEEWKAADQVYRELIAEGQTDGLQTALNALRIAFPEGQAKAEAPRETTSQRQRSVETPGSSSGRSSTEKKPGSKGWPSWLEETRVEYYEEAIRRGRYKGKEDPMLKKELEILKKRHEAAA